MRELMRLGQQRVDAPLDKALALRVRTGRADVRDTGPGAPLVHDSHPLQLVTPSRSCLGVTLSWSASVRIGGSSSPASTWQDDAKYLI